MAAVLHGDAAGARERMIERGVVCRAIGDAMAFCPPLTTSDAEIDEMIEVFAASIEP